MYAHSLEAACGSGVVAHSLPLSQWPGYQGEQFVRNLSQVLFYSWSPGRNVTRMGVFSQLYLTPALSPRGDTQPDNPCLRGGLDIPALQGPSANALALLMYTSMCLG